MVPVSGASVRPPPMLPSLAGQTRPCYLPSREWPACVSLPSACSLPPAHCIATPHSCQQPTLHGYQRASRLARRRALWPTPTRCPFSRALAGYLAVRISVPSASASPVLTKPPFAFCRLRSAPYDDGPEAALLCAAARRSPPCPRDDVALAGEWFPKELPAGTLHQADHLFSLSPTGIQRTPPPARPCPSATPVKGTGGPSTASRQRVARSSAAALWRPCDCRRSKGVFRVSADGRYST